MWFGRIGGLLVVGGCVLFMIAAAIAIAGGGVGIGLRDVGGLVVAASLALGGSGAAILSVAGPGPLHGRVTRIGLGILAVGLLSSLASSTMAAASAGHEASLPIFVLFIVGSLSTVLGSLVTGLSLVRAPGPSRAVGLVFLAGLLLLAFSRIPANMASDALPLQEIAAALAVLGGIGVVLGGAGVGVLAISGGRSAAATSA